MENNIDQLVQTAYNAFNLRDIDTALSTMTEDVEWPKAFEGGYVQGHEAIRDYWTRQWSEINPIVTPSAIEKRDENTFAVKINQLVKDLENNVIFDGVVTHVYSLENGLFRKMDIELS